jgi:hypothetical protein
MVIENEKSPLICRDLTVVEIRGLEPLTFTMPL